VLYRRALTIYVARFPIVAGAAVVIFVPLEFLMTAFLLSAAAPVSVAAFVGLIEVTLAFALIHREAAARGR
jgi:hypothetical protein